MANLCPFWWHVVNEVRLVTDRLFVARRMLERKARRRMADIIAQIGGRLPSMTNVERKRKRWHLLLCSEAITLEHWPVILPVADVWLVKGQISPDAAVLTSVPSPPSSRR